MVVNKTFGNATIPDATISTPNLKALGLLSSIANRDPSKILLPAVYDLLERKEKLYYAYIYSYYMFEAGLGDEETVKKIVLNKIDASKHDLIYSHP